MTHAPATETQQKPSPAPIEAASREDLINLCRLLVRNLSFCAEYTANDDAKKCAYAAIELAAQVSITVEPAPGSEAAS